MIAIISCPTTSHAQTRNPSRLNCDENGPDRFLCLEDDVDTADGYNWNFNGLQSNENAAVDPDTPFEATVDCTADLGIPADGDTGYSHGVNVMVWMRRKLSTTYPIGPQDNYQVRCHGQAPHSGGYLVMVDITEPEVQWYWQLYQLYGASCVNDWYNDFICDNSIAFSWYWYLFG